jgi:hypothetical protein
MRDSSQLPHSIGPKETLLTISQLTIDDSAVAAKTGSWCLQGAESQISRTGQLETFHMLTMQPELLALVDRALEQKGPTQISIGGAGHIAIYPQQQAFTADIRDWGGIAYSEVRNFPVSAVIPIEPPADSRPVDELRWLIAYHHACQTATVEALPRGLVRLQSWPDLSCVPSELAGTVARICALLWRKSTASHLVARVLTLDPKLTAILFCVLQRYGHVDLVDNFSDRVEGEASPSNFQSLDASRASFVGKVWQHLLGR